jgi:hypothetical protein
MADALQMVRDMAAECERGQTPALLGQFLREQILREAFEPRGWFSRWWSRARTLEVSQVVPLEDHGFFRRTCVFHVFARGVRLEAAVVPSRQTTFGLFSLSPTGLRYLQHRQDNVEELLREEGRALDECAPTVLASLVADAFGRDLNSSHDVLASSEFLMRYQRERGTSGGGYELNPREWDRVHTRVTAPLLMGDSGSGWRLRFCTVFGWMHDKQQLIHHDYGFAADFRIQHREEVLSRRIFKRTPHARY